MLQLQKFIKENNNWEELLKDKPYNVSTKHKNGLVLFKYGIDSDFSNSIVQECRGTILNENTFEVVACPFFKFGNYHESYVPEIDWNTARVQEKMDGTLIVLYYYNEKWNVSTTGCIDATDANLSSNLNRYHNFYELFQEAVRKVRLNFDVLNKNYTYMFELVSPYNQVVIQYHNIDLIHIGTRDNQTLQELNVDIGITKPKEYPLNTLDDCIKFANTFRGHEGFVVVDKNWNRIKVKNPAYVAMHHAVNNHVLTLERVIEIQDSGEEDEFLNYFPQYIDDFWDMTLLRDCLLQDIQDILDKLDLMYYNNRKEKAEYLLSTNFPDAGFMYLDKKIKDAVEYYNSLNTDKKAKIFKRYKPKMLQQ